MQKILVVEDDKFLSSALRVKLEKSGFEVKTALDGQEGIEVLAAFTPDIILLDLIMPRKDGFAVLEYLKNSDALKKIPVIIISNLGQKEDIDRGMRMGARDYFIKSEIPLAEVVVKIKTLLKSSTAQT